MVTEKKTIKIGVVSVDTGKLMICDPFYLREWKNNKIQNNKQYLNKRNGEIYSYKKDFLNYSDVLSNTPKRY